MVRLASAFGEALDLTKATLLTCLLPKFVTVKQAMPTPLSEASLNSTQRESADAGRERGMLNV